MPERTSRFVTAIAAFVALSVAISRAQIAVQEAKAAPVEVSTVKVSAETRGGSLLMQPGGRMIATNIRVTDMVYMAFQAHPAFTPEQILGLPDWASAIRYNIEAKFTVSDATSAAGQTNSGAYIRAVLNSRFAFQAHLERRELPVYVLSVATGGFSPKPVDVNCESPDNRATCATTYGRGRVKSGAMSAGELVDELRSALHAPVVDRTALRGQFDVDLQWNPDPLADANDPRPTIFGAAQGLGLRLERDKGVVDVLVIDHVEQPTAD